MSQFNETYFDQIEAYLLGQMSDDQKSDFEQALASDQALAAQFKQQELEHRAMQIMREDSLRQQMAAWKAEREAASVKPAVIPLFWSTRRIFQIAIAASFLLVAGFFAYDQLTTPNSISQFAAYYPQVQMGGSRDNSILSPTSDTLEQAKALLADEKYEAAEQLLKSISATNLSYAEAQMYYADSRFKQGDYDGASRQLKSLIQSGVAPSKVVEAAEFRLLVTYYTQGNAQTSEAKQLVQQINSNTNHSFKKPVETMVKAAQ
jgi:Tetratricopeptide repeat